jgi:hypothetical protein
LLHKLVDIELAQIVKAAHWLRRGRSKSWQLINGYNILLYDRQTPKHVTTIMACSRSDITFS